jgi:16S rRNA (guanine(966)-N(2))-methyltransferase RsmD
MPALRITAGTLRGRRVPVPSEQVRPTSERARQAYFNVVSPRISGANFLDLFAGSGIFSLEAISRGAASATAVDRQVRDVEKLAKELQVNVLTIAGDVVEVVKRLKTPFDLVYADPPYDYDHYDALLAALDEHAPLADDALVAIEHRRRTMPFTVTTSRLRETRRNEYGEVWITFFEGAPA